MTTRLISRAAKAFAIPLIALCAICAPVGAHAGPGGGGHGGGGHGGGGGHAGGFHSGYAGHGVGGARGGYGYRGGYGRHGGYGYRGGYGGWHGGYGYRGGYGYGGWGGLGFGLFLSTLPFYYSTLWWDGVPYYYADDNYYLWNGSAGQYETVSPPQEVVDQAATQQSVTDLFAYPKNGQSPDQQDRDKRECRSWAATQSAVDAAPSDPASAVPATSALTSATKHEGYLRAQAACLEARGYSVK
jgi:hypothetical protein